MKMTLLRNYWLMIIAWCLYLNGYEVLSGVLVFGASGYLLVMKSEVNYWRIAAVALTICVLSEMVLLDSNIPYFFPGLKYYLILTSINCALANEYLYAIKNRFILPVLISVSLYVCAMSVVVYMLPEQSYTILGKNSLYLMIMFIFLPYLSVMTIACLCKARIVLSRKWRLD